MTKRLVVLIAGLIWVLGCDLHCDATEGRSSPDNSQAERPGDLSPGALIASADGRALYIACATANQVLVFDVTRGKVARTIAVLPSPLGLALSPDDLVLFVTSPDRSGVVQVVSVAAGAAVGTIPVGHWPVAPVVSPDSRSMYVCNRFTGTVSVIDLAEARLTQSITVAREPIAAALTPDGRLLLVAHHLHGGRANAEAIALPVSVIDTATRRVVKEIALPSGATLARDIRISPDGRYACVTHLLARFQLPAIQIERGWINSNAMTIIDLTELKPLNTVLLDDLSRGAATPWAIAWTSDARFLCITHAGTHELSVIEWPALIGKLARTPARSTPNGRQNYDSATGTSADVLNDFSFLSGLRRRLKLPGLGPRTAVAVGSRVFVAEYFSDTLSRVDLNEGAPAFEQIVLGAKHDMTVIRRGEFLFNDASICFQNWQSCASCHSSDGRVDGLNWDLLNDGINNPKNNKSLLMAHQTPPSMAHGVRADASAAVRAGIKFVLFANRPEDEAAAIDEYLKSLQPVPSPYLVNGKLSAAAERGKALFFDDSVGCAACHPPPLFCDLKLHAVGTLGKFDKASDWFDSPTLLEVWRTGPYLHDGSAPTIRDVLTTHNPNDQHGRTSHLIPEQIDDLAEYVLSL
jgi:DNA-binding beta-propeller fold protein YncE